MKIAGYCRVSTDKEEQLDSFENQKLFFDDYAKKAGHKLVRIYADEGISGKSLKKRDEFLRLMEDAQLGLFEAVVVKDISRFARNTVDFLQSIRTLKGFGINTIFVTANMDTLGESEFILTIFGAMAQEEIANLSKRVKFGKKITGAKGRAPTHAYGYDHVDNYTLAINEEEAKYVRDIFRMYVNEGIGAHTIALRLNQMGLQTKFGARWDQTGVLRILTNSLYCGDYQNHKYEIQDYLTGKLVSTPEEQRIHHSRPEWAIIPQETFYQAQRILQDRRAKQKNSSEFRKYRHSGKHLFSTMIRCTSCGRAFAVRKNKSCSDTWTCSTYRAYSTNGCNNKIIINQDELLDRIREYLQSIISDRDAFIKSILDRTDRVQPEVGHRDKRDDLEKRQAKLLRVKERYQDMYANDIISMAELKSKMESVSSELELISDMLDGVQTHHPSAEDYDSLKKAYVNEIERFLNLETVTNVDLKRIIEKIDVSESGDVKIVIKNIE